MVSLSCNSQKKKFVELFMIVYSVWRNPNTVKSAVHTLQAQDLQYNLQGSSGTRGLAQDICYQPFPCLQILWNFPNIDAGMNNFSPNIKESLSAHEVYKIHLSPQEFAQHIMRRLIHKFSVFQGSSYFSKYNKAFWGIQLTPSSSFSLNLSLKYLKCFWISFLNMKCLW